MLYLIFALGVAHLLLLCGVEGQRWLAQRQELHLVAGQTGTLAAEVANLREELARADDTAYLEERARSLGYVYSDEVLHAEPR
jgi:cell division protein FtsB